MQQHWLMPSGTARITAVVTEPGTTSVGTLQRIDEFLVTIELADGTQRTFERRGEVPMVQLRDPLAGHRALLPIYTDKDIHDLTAYLETFK